ncbi:MAG TPA: hypothetical protein VHJ82_08175 [Actinomycetota bacterium]|nr:hypothetical protein [Actinomycetota bacterium]
MEESRTGIEHSAEHSPAPTAEPTPTSSPLPRAMFKEVDHFTGGPGVAMTKSQARGGLTGALLGLFAGALIGLVVGIIFFDGNTGRLVSVVAVAVAGTVAGGVAGGIVRPMQRMEDTPADT